MFNKKDYLKMLSLWNLEYNQVCPEFKINGSPERVLFRTVIEDKNHNLFLLEELYSSSFKRKEKIANFINQLKSQGLNKIIPYLPGLNQKFIQYYEKRFFQISPFLNQACSIPRPGFEKELWRSEKISSFLIDLKMKSSFSFFNQNENPFNIKAYIIQFQLDTKKHHPAVFFEIKKSTNYLKEKLFPFLPQLKNRFNHGDIHPLNILWSQDDLLAVIDWEFAGIKPENYDLANLIGTIGMENPLNLSGDFIKNLIDKLKETNYLSPLGWETLPAMILAIRFGWLSEWLRKEDSSMIALELKYWKILKKIV